MNPAAALVVCQKYMKHPSWAGLGEDDFTFEVVTGGLTNKLYKCGNTRVDASPAEVLVR